MAELVLAIEYLHHSLRITHQDLKSDNILLDMQGSLADTISVHVDLSDWILKNKHAMRKSQINHMTDTMREISGA